MICHLKRDSVQVVDDVVSFGVERHIRRGRGVDQLRTGGEEPFQ